MDTGPFFSGTITHPGGPTLKGIAIRLGDQRQAAVCFDTELIRMSCGWTGEFLRFGTSRFGLLSAQSMAGTHQFHLPRQPGVTPNDRFDDPRDIKTTGPLPRAFARYEGLYLHGPRVVLQYTVGNTAVWESPWAVTRETTTIFTRDLCVEPGEHEIRILIGDSKVLRTAFVSSGDIGRIEVTSTGQSILVIAPRPQVNLIRVAFCNIEAATLDQFQQLFATLGSPVDLRNWISGGPGRWGGPLETRGTVSTRKAAYVVDTLTIPFDNPYRALMFTSGHDFFATGDAAVCTVHGDVWMVHGIDGPLQQLKWKRFATGLFQPLGLKILSHAPASTNGPPKSSSERIYVLGRDQITVLHDLNEDGEADWYQNYNNEGQMTTNAHEFATCLESDSRGHLYYLRGDSGSQTQHDGCLLRVSSNGQKLEVFATGFRNANGLGIGPDDTITVAPQEGSWTPGSAIFEVKQGGFYGAMQSHHRTVAPTQFDPPICWIPRLQDNSSGGQVWGQDKRFGPFAGQLLHFSFGTSRMFTVLRESTEAGTQGGTVQWPLVFDSGVMRGRFREKDGQLYVTGLKGWVSNAVQDGCFQRVRYTGLPVDSPLAFQTFADGIALTFSEPLDRATAEDPENYRVEAWNYLWSAGYGSADYKISAKNQIGRDDWEVASATLLSDGKTVFVELPDIRPAMQVALSYALKSQSGRQFDQTFNATLHKLGKSPQPEKLTRRPRPGQISPEIEAQLEPGLKWQRSTDQDQRNYIGVSRLAAFTADSATSVAAGNAILPRFRLTGFLKIPKKESYRFQISVLSEASRLKLNGKQITWNDPVELQRGYVSLEWEVSSPVTECRLLWHSAGFPWESIPPTNLFHRADDSELIQAQRVEEGRDEFHWRGCANCHSLATPSTKTEQVTDSAHRGPRLEHLGERLNPTWIAHWLQRPSHLRKQALMPQFFDDQPAFEQRRQIADLTQFLVSLRRPVGESAQHTAVNQDGDSSLVEAGRSAFETLGCLGCHRLTPPAEIDPTDRISLYTVASKFLPGQLQEFLMHPQSHYPNSRMPDFQLAREEAQALDAYLRSESQGRLEPWNEIVDGDANRGRMQFDQFGCRSCHQIAAQDPVLAPFAGSLTAINADPGCLDPLRHATPKQPRHLLSPKSAAAIQDFLTHRLQSGMQPMMNTNTRQLLRRLRCQACHSRDDKNSQLPELVAEEGSGLPPEMLPHLTWSGEKLSTLWIQKLLEGKLKERTRPWLKARMPAFSAYAVTLAQAFAKEHGYQQVLSVSERPPQSVDQHKAELGHLLTLKNNGLDCRQCHGLGDVQPSGDKATLIAVGINFSQIPQRLNPEFFPRLMWNPSRYDPNSRMPLFAPDGPTTKATQILNGDAASQFESIWEYLRTVRP